MVVVSYSFLSKSCVALAFFVVLAAPSPFSQATAESVVVGGLGAEPSHLARSSGHQVGHGFLPEPGTSPVMLLLPWLFAAAVAVHL